MSTRAALVLLLLFSPLAPARGQAGDQAARIARELAGAREAVERLRRRESTALVEVDRAEAALRSAQVAAERARQDAARAAEELALARAVEHAARERLRDRLAELAPRLLVRYRLERQGRAAILLEADSAAELVRRDAALRRVLASDVDRVQLAAAAADDVARSSEAAQAASDRAEARASSALAAERAAEDAAGSRRVILDALRGERGLQEQLIDDLAQAQLRLAEALGALPRGRGSGFARLKGKLPPPVDGVVEVPFGKMVNPLFNTVTFQRGQDVRAPAGSEVIAVAEGRVVHAGWFGGYGNLVIVDHGEGFHSLYAHLSATAREVGDEVKEGDLIGLVGDTGSLKGSYLYFEIRDHGKPVDPRDWLRPTR